MFMNSCRKSGRPKKQEEGANRDEAKRPQGYRDNRTDEIIAELCELC